MRAALDDLANLFASFFHVRLFIPVLSIQSSDIVFSDVAAGLLLVVHSPLNVYPPLVPYHSDRPRWMTEKNALHYLHFASGVYGWPTYLLHNFSCSSCCKLFRSLQCCGQLRCDQVNDYSTLYPFRSSLQIGSISREEKARTERKGQKLLRAPALAERLE